MILLTDYSYKFLKVILLEKKMLHNISGESLAIGFCFQCYLSRTQWFNNFSMESLASAEH